MGICFSKKKDPPSLPSTPPPPPQPPTTNSINNVPVAAKKTETKTREAAAVAEAATEKKPVFIITQNKKPPAEEKDKVAHSPKKKAEHSPKKERAVVSEDTADTAAAAAAPVRTSSCTKEEVDAILIQCGRLSRSSSGSKVSNDTAAHRRYSGSKRSYDFDNDKPGEDDSEKATSRPSPRRRASSRERSGSRERASGSGGGSRRVSRSPGRRSDGPASSNSSAGDRSKQQQQQLQQPGKLVSVPAREKSVEAAAKKASPAVTTKRGSSPRARSPANPSRISNENPSQPQSLSRSSSRKAEQSPFRRNPMAEIDDNTVRSNQSKQQRPGHSHPQKSNANAISNCVRDQLMNVRPKEQQDTEITAKTSSKGSESHHQLANEIVNPRRSFTRTRSSRRSSRDFDLNPEALLINPPSYTTLLLEDINNYHQQSSNAAADFPLPSCVSKACSILEAVADLNSDNKSHQGEGSGTDNGRRFGRRGLAPFVESEIVVKDDLMEPSIHKYITVRGESDVPQESAGSNSFSGQPWASSPWEPNSADSSDRCWTSRSNRSEEVEEEQSLPEASCRPVRGGGSACAGNGGRGGGRRDISLAASTAATF